MMVKSIAVVLLLVAVVGLPPIAGAAQTGASLANTSWVLAETAVQRAAFVPALGNPPPTLVFGSDGRVSGNAGCNSFGGPYTQTGDELRMGPLVATLRACAEESLNQQESLILRVLGGTGGSVAVTRSGNKLTLSAPAGALNYVLATGSAGTGSPSAPSVLPVTGGQGPGWLAVVGVAAVLLIAAGRGLRRRVA